jgi:hypothetical protein
MSSANPGSGSATVPRMPSASRSGRPRRAGGASGMLRGGSGGLAMLPFHSWLTSLCNRTIAERVRTAAPPLLPVFRSRLQGRLLALVLADPGVEWTVDQLSERTGEPYQTVANEVRRLQAADLVAVRSVGRSKLLRANEDSPYFRPLAQLALMSFGPPLVVGEEFASLAGVQEIFIFGSIPRPLTPRPTTPRTLAEANQIRGANSGRFWAPSIAARRWSSHVTAMPGDAALEEQVWCQPR